MKLEACACKPAPALGSQACRPWTQSRARGGHSFSPYLGVPHVIFPRLSPSHLFCTPLPTPRCQPMFIKHLLCVKPGGGQRRGPRALQPLQSPGKMSPLHWRAGALEGWGPPTKRRDLLGGPRAGGGGLRARRGWNRAGASSRGALTVNRKALPRTQLRPHTQSTKEPEDSEQQGTAWGPSPAAAPAPSLCQGWTACRRVLP